MKVILIFHLNFPGTEVRIFQQNKLAAISSNNIAVLSLPGSVRDCMERCMVDEVDHLITFSTAFLINARA